MNESQSKENLLLMNSKLNTLQANSSEYLNYLNTFFNASDLHKSNFGSYPKFNK